MHPVVTRVPDEADDLKAVDRAVGLSCLEPAADRVLALEILPREGRVDQCNTTRD
jgi:hypothetical protein